MRPLNIYFRYGDDSPMPMVAHNEKFDCPYAAMGYHHPSECGDNRIAKLALEGGNIVFKQPLFGKLNRRNK